MDESCNFKVMLKVRGHKERRGGSTPHTLKSKLVVVKDEVKSYKGNICE